MVTAKLPPFSRAGQNIDVVVSSMGNAKSLRGGTLLMTPLKGVDNQVYALAQGNVLVGGAGAAAGGSSVQVNQLAGGRISNGATIERELPTTFGSGGVLNLQLNDEDFTLAQQISDAINRQRGGGTATPLDARTIQVLVPQGNSSGALPGGDSKHHRQRRGDGCQSDHQLAHGFGGDEPRCDPRLLRRRPGQPVGGGRSAEHRQPTDDAVRWRPDGGDAKHPDPVQQQGGSLQKVNASANLNNVIRALNALGATPIDLMSILQAMQSAGCLRAKLEII